MPGPALAQNHILGNIGASLDPNWWNLQFDDDEDLEGVELENQDESMVEGNGVTTHVPVVRIILFFLSRMPTQEQLKVYDGEGAGDIEMVPMQREVSVAGPLGSTIHMA